MTTRVLQNIDSTPEAVAVHYCVRGNFVLIDTTAKPDGSREALYQRVVGNDDIDHPASIRVGYYPKAGGVNFSVKYSTYVKQTTDGVDRFDPCVGTLALQLPEGGLSIEGIDHFLQNIITWLLPINTGTDSFMTGGIDLLKFGVINTLNNWDV